MPIAEFPIGPLGTNCLVVHQKGQAIVVDPGGDLNADLNEVIDFLTSRKLELKAILLTHLHFDHIFGVADLKAHFGDAVQVLAGPKDLAWLDESFVSSERFGLPRVKPFTAEPLAEGDFAFGNIHGTILYTPGHTPGGLSIYLPDEEAVLAGDTLFARSVGRTDLEGGDFPTLRDSITKKLFALPDSTMVYCGHGPSTSIGSEKTSNPFV